IYQKTSKLSDPSNHKSAVLGTYVLPVQKLFMVPLRTPVSHVVLSIHGSPLSKKTTLLLRSRVNYLGGKWRLATEICLHRAVGSVETRFPFPVQCTAS